MADVDQLTAQLESQADNEDNAIESTSVLQDATNIGNKDQNEDIAIESTSVLQDATNIGNKDQNEDIAIESTSVLQDATNIGNKDQNQDNNNEVTISLLEGSGDGTMPDVSRNSEPAMPGGDLSMMVEASITSQNSEPAMPGGNLSVMDTSITSQNSEPAMPGGNLSMIDTSIPSQNSEPAMPGGNLSVMDTSITSQNSEPATPGGDLSMMDTSITSQNSEPGTPNMKKEGKYVGKWSKYKKRYNIKWEKEPGLMEWIRRVPGDDTKVLCRFCQNTHRAHRTELRRHANSTKHKSQSAFVVLPDASNTHLYSQLVPRMFKCMRVIRVTEWGGPEVLEVFSDVSMPEPENDQVLIKVGAVGVNPVDAYIRSGQYANLPNLPWTPGADCSGTVENVGHLVNNIKPGDRVYTNGSLTGTYAEYTLCNEDCVFHLPDQLDFKGGAALGTPYFTAYRALMQRAKARPGQTVLIHGASGSVGMATVQFARAYGMTVLGTAGTDAGMTLVRQFGAHFVFNHKQSDYTHEILTATEGDGVDVVIEMLANVNLQNDLELLAMGGTIAVVGNRGTVEINPRLLMPKESSIVGVMLPKCSKKERTEIATSIKAGIESGWIRPHIGLEFALENAPFAHEELMAGNGSQGRIVVVP